MASKDEEIVLAGGCFWGLQELLRQLDGVTHTEVGYCGGHTPSPTYDEVKTGQSGHAEAVRVQFNAARISLETLLLEFFRMHDPTTLNRQGNDVGTQYRSAIVCGDLQQRAVAEKAIQVVDQSGKWPRKVTTQVLVGLSFFPAEEFHQDYLRKNPNGYTCHYLRSWSYDKTFQNKDQKET